ncbi:hypothetical protein SKAU_G00206330 [Synaphobranchus kaupii]|uniref:Uncharacterized protein n=1 Tax=Synaphobranchus kaupii TaxID=118154 RepID=A0A9Q1FGI9_SYNKA|nr:hypothetical protein SKAU_G00206330 [Synaphobranchus kaupii]
MTSKMNGECTQEREESGGRRAAGERSRTKEPLECGKNHCGKCKRQRGLRRPIPTHRSDVIAVAPNPRISSVVRSHGDVRGSPVTRRAQNSTMCAMCRPNDAPAMASVCVAMENSLNLHRSFPDAHSLA